MAYLVSHTPAASVKQKSFNGIRRTKNGMLYLSSVNPNKGNETIEVSNYFEDGKSDFVGRAETDYVDERLEMFDVQYFTSDGSAYQFTLGTPVLNETRIALFLDGVQQTPYSDFTLVNNTVVTFTLIPKTGLSIVCGQIDKRYFNNDSDRYQQINFSENPTTTFLINNSSGDLVKRSNAGVTRSAEGTDDFATFEDTTGSSSTTTYQSAV
jgi:hypothetical protein|tara:strand:+ start:7399 stop:8028 length:630 start_codon:yes stop_codon:yes gene_type:complete